MKIKIFPSSPAGTVKAIASKSAAHRLLICAAFADAPTTLRCEEINEDISATVRCLCALGAQITRSGADFYITPIDMLPQKVTLDCGESGSTMRFLVPIVCALGIEAEFVMAGRLPERPLSPLRELLEENGIRFSEIGSNPLSVCGKLSTTNFSIAGNVSSQFISGLLFSLAICGKAGSITVLGKLESEPYVEMTLDALETFGVPITRCGQNFRLSDNATLRTPASLCVEGDWSNAAFWLSLGAIGNSPITVDGLNPNSRQGDRAVLSILEQFGAKVSVKDQRITVAPAHLRGVEIDATQIPDLVPILATVASVANGQTVIRGAARLRIKESDRLQTVHHMLCSLGAKVTELDDGLIIDGVHSLNGGTVSSFGDHRIAMSAAIAASACTSAVIVERAESAAKSYPDFWKDLAALGVTIQPIE